MVKWDICNCDKERHAQLIQQKGRTRSTGASVECTAEQVKGLRISFEQNMTQGKWSKVSRVTFQRHFSRQLQLKDLLTERAWELCTYDKMHGTEHVMR